MKNGIKQSKSNVKKFFFRKVDDRETNRPGLILRALKGHYDVLAHKHQQKHTTQSCGVIATLGGDFFGLAFLSLNLTGNLLLDVRHSTPLFFIFLIGAKETEEERKYAIASFSR